jgi:hypothetical protein
MFPHIIENPILVRTPQNIWKYHITRLAETDTKLQPCCRNFMAQIRVDWAFLSHELNALRPPLDSPKDPQVQPWLKLSQPVHSMLLSIHTL